MPKRRSPASRIALRLGFCAFAVIAAVFLWAEHRAHLAGAFEWLPWLVLVLCPVIHILMHRGHEHHGAREDRHDGTSSGGRA